MGDTVPSRRIANAGGPLSSQETGRTRDGDLRRPDQAPAPGLRGVSPLDVAIGVVVALMVLGPALRSGPLLDLDLLVTPEIPVPNGLWGLGPALSQRVPLFV